MAARRSFTSLAALGLCIAAIAAPEPVARAEDAPAWHDTLQTRLAALALIETLNAEVLASRSATLTLEAWCADHKLATAPRISARLVRGADKPPTTEQRQRLAVSASESVRYRHVELRCGDHILSIADNWYVPARLTADMNRLLDGTDTPFGKAVLALAPTRQTFAATILWSPLPAGWELPGARPPQAAPGAPLPIPEALFEHRALLFAKDGRPFSEVDEIYQRGVLAFPEPGT